MKSLQKCLRSLQPIPAVAEIPPVPLVVPVQTQQHMDVTTTLAADDKSVGDLGRRRSPFADQLFIGVYWEGSGTF